VVRQSSTKTATTPHFSTCSPRQMPNTPSSFLASVSCRITFTGRAASHRCSPVSLHAVADDQPRQALPSALPEPWACLARPVQKFSDSTRRTSPHYSPLCPSQSCSRWLGRARHRLVLVKPSTPASERPFACRATNRVASVDRSAAL
jgi:hypothetical protein